MVRFPSTPDKAVKRAEKAPQQPILARHMLCGFIKNGGWCSGRSAQCVVCKIKKLPN